MGMADANAARHLWLFTYHGDTFLRGSLYQIRVQCGERQAFAFRKLQIGCVINGQPVLRAQDENGLSLEKREAVQPQ